MSAQALQSLPLEVRYLADDFSLLVIPVMPQWIMVGEKLYPLH